MFSTLLPSLKLPVTLLGTGRESRGYRISFVACRTEALAKAGQGFAVVYYSFTLDAADLPDSGICEEHPQLLQR